MNVRETKDKLSGTHVENIDTGRWYVVDKATNAPLYNEINGDDLLIPKGYLIALVDTGTYEVKIGNGKVWSDCIPFSSGSEEPTTVTSENITDASDVGKSVLTAVDAIAARTALGAGTSNLSIGTTATTAKSGDYQPTWAQVTGKPATFAPTIGTTATTALAGNTVIPAAATWANISGKPAVVAAGADAAAARTAIGAGTGNGTSNLTLAQAQAGIATKAAIAALVSPTTDFADLTEATAAVKSIIDALKA